MGFDVTWRHAPRCQQGDTFNAAAVGLSGSAHTACQQTSGEEKAQESRDEVPHATLCCQGPAGSQDSGGDPPGAVGRVSDRLIIIFAQR